MRRFIMVATAALAAAPATANQAQEQSTLIQPRPLGSEVELSTGIEYQQGKYGTGQNIEETSIPINLRVSTGGLQFSATLPYVRIDAPGNVVGGGGGIFGLPIIIDPNQPATRNRREGFGDLTLGAAYTVPSLSFGLTLLGQVKVPITSERKRLGTGEIDYALGAELSKRFGILTPFIGVTYTTPGDPKGYELRNSLSARAGVATMLGSRVRGYVSYNYAQSLSPLTMDEQQLATGINAGLSDRLGLSQGSPDIGAGVQLGVKFF
jgi:hypothetical protein